MSGYPTIKFFDKDDKEPVDVSLYMCVCVYYINVCVLHNCVYSVFDKLIWYTIATKSFLFDAAQFSLWASGTA